MGNSTTKYQKEHRDIKQHLQAKYTVEEMKQWHQRFKSQYPTGNLDKAQFRKLYVRFYPQGDTAELADDIFRLFDVDGDERINFNEFMFALSVQCRGSNMEKVQWIFNLFDANADGQVTKGEMMQMFQSIAKLEGRNNNNNNSFDQLLVEEEEGRSPEEYVDMIYRKLDKNEDGVLTLEEFLMLESTDLKLVNMICGLGRVLR